MPRGVSEWRDEFQINGIRSKANYIETAAIAELKLTGQDVHIARPVVFLEALQARLNQFHNSRASAGRMVEIIDRRIETS